MSEKPQEPFDVTKLSVLDVLELCERDFAFIGGCTMTDMPDVPLSPETSWKMDCTHVMAAIAVAKEKLCGLGVVHIASECADCGTPQPMQLPSGQSKCALEHGDSRSPAGGSA